MTPGYDSCWNYSSNGQNQKTVPGGRRRGTSSCQDAAMSTTSGAYPQGSADPSVIVRPALPADARRIFDLVAPYASERILIAKELISYFEAIQEFLMAELPADDGDWQVVGCGALHVMWDDIAEIRTLAVDPQ